jgi:cobalt-zinc-cadmium efflux system protein
LAFTFVISRMPHDHNHSHSHHHHADVTNASKALILGIVLNLTFVVVEAGAGFFSGSLALLSDAGHNLSDVAGLALALLAFRLFQFKPNKEFTYGYRRASILISLLNAIILLLAVGSIGYESIQRFLNPSPIASITVIWVAAVGIAINAASALLFLRNKDHDLNLKGAYLHLVVDALVSVGVVISGIVIYYTDWLWIDPLLSIVIMIVIVISTWNLLSDSLRLSIDAVPRNIDLEKVRQTALKFSGIKDIHHIHVWALSTSDNALTAHLVMDDSISQDEVSTIKNKFRHELEHLGIQHATLETETRGCDDAHC